jgi:hypothetical protein
MATKQDKSKSTPNQNPPADNTASRSARTSDAADPTHIALPDAVAQALDTERARLMQAHAVLKCLQQVLEYAEDDDAQYCADSAGLIARAIDDAVAQLDPTRLRRLAKAARGGDYEVREPALPYYGSADDYCSEDRHPHGSLRLLEARAEYKAA